MATINYTLKAKENKEFPLLVQTQWKKNNEKNAINETRMAFVFLHGVLFAECTIVNNALTCETQNPLAQNMALQMAKFTSEAISKIQTEQRFNQRNFTSNTKNQNLYNKEFIHETKKYKIQLQINDYNATN